MGPNLTSAQSPASWTQEWPQQTAAIRSKDYNWPYPNITPTWTSKQISWIRRMEAPIAATTVLTDHARTNTGLVCIHGMNKNYVAKHAENERHKMPRMMIVNDHWKKKLQCFQKFICCMLQTPPERICSSQDFTSENKRSSKWRQNKGKSHKFRRERVNIFCFSRYYTNARNTGKD